MQKVATLIVISMLASLSSGCIATRKFVRGEVGTTSDSLNARIDTTDSDVKEVRDGVDRVNSRVTEVDGKVAQTGQRVDTLTGEVQVVDQKAVQAQSLADRATGAIAVLDQKFAGRNSFVVADQKTIYFRFNSAKLQEDFEAVLDEIAGMLLANADSLVVLEGRTDSTGDSDYNVKLGERRVEAVRRYLAVEKSVPVYRIHQISFGAARPVAANDSREGREKNRAVTLLILNPRTDPAMVSK